MRMRARALWDRIARTETDGRPAWGADGRLFPDDLQYIRSIHTWAHYTPFRPNPEREPARSYAFSLLRPDTDVWIAL